MGGVPDVDGCARDCGGTKGLGRGGGVKVGGVRREGRASPPARLGLNPATGCLVNGLLKGGLGSGLNGDGADPFMGAFCVGTPDNGCELPWLMMFPAAEAGAPGEAADGACVKAAKGCLELSGMFIELFRRHYLSRSCLKETVCSAHDASLSKIPTFFQACP